MATQPLKIVALGGSLRLKSSSLLALKIALEGALEAGAKTELLDVRALDLPMYSPDTDAESVPAAAHLIAEAVYAAPGLNWASPHYHGTVSGSFKNALDWLQLLAQREPPFLTDKVIGLISTAGGVQGLQTINTMEYVVRALRAWAVPLVVPIPQAWQAFDENDRPRDQGIETQLRTLGTEVARVAQRMTLREVSDPAAECDEAATRAANARIGARK